MTCYDHPPQTFNITILCFRELSINFSIPEIPYSSKSLHGKNLFKAPFEILRVIGYYRGAARCEEIRYTRIWMWQLIVAFITVDPVSSYYSITYIALFPGL